MKMLILGMSLVLVSGCTTTQRKVGVAVGTVLAVGLINAHSHHDGAVQTADRGKATQPFTCIHSVPYDICT